MLIDPHTNEATAPSCPRKRTAAAQRVFLDEFERQNTDKLREQLFKYARTRVKMAHDSGLPTEPNLAMHLVTSALTDTVLGDIHWEPSACDLRFHAKRVIKYRTKDMIARGARYRHERLDNALDDDDGIEARVAAHVHHRSVADRAVCIDLVSHIADALTELAEANNDEIVLRILDAHREGVFGRSEVAEHAGISRKQYDRARERIKTLLKKLPEPLALGAAEMLGGRR